MRVSHGFSGTKEQMVQEHGNNLNFSPGTLENYYKFKGKRELFLIFNRKTGTLVVVSKGAREQVQPPWETLIMG